MGKQVTDIRKKIKSDQTVKSDFKNPRNKLKNAIDISEPRKILKLKIPGQKRKSISDILYSPNPEHEVEEKKCVVKRKKPFFEGKTLELLPILLISITLICVLTIVTAYYRSLELKKEILKYAYAGLEDLEETIPHLKASNLEDSEIKLLSALENFKQAQNAIWFLKENKAKGASKSLIAGVNAVLTAGSRLTEAGLYFTGFSNSLKMILKEMWNNDNPASLTNVLDLNYNNLKKGHENIKVAQEELKSVNVKFLPGKLQSEFMETKEKIAEADKLLEEFLNHWPAFMKMLGDRHPQRYLILFANNNEIRPIMGFLGSMVLLDFNEGKIEGMKFYDVYDFDGQIGENIPAPEMFSSLTQNWGLRDSNYSPDFTFSAKAASRLFEKGGGPGVDHLVIIDLEFVRSLLKTIGPVQVEGLNKVFTAENFDTLISLVVESKMEGENAPKQILNRFIESLLAKMKLVDLGAGLVKIFKNNIEQKHLMAYSKDENVQELFRFFQMTGEVPKFAEKQDFLNIVHTNIGGNKSDKYITNSYRHQTFIDGKGEILNHLRLIRTHNWDIEEERYLDELASDYGLPAPDSNLKEIMGRGQNISYVRVYVPKNSILKQVIGADKTEVETKIDQDLDMTYFQFTLTTFPSETNEITLIYALPYKLNFNEKSGLDDYYLHVSKQAGSLNEPFIKEIILSGGLKSYKHFPSMYLSKDILFTEADLQTDLQFGSAVGF